MIWALVIAVAMLVIAVVIHTVVFEVAEIEEAFFGIVGGFLVLFVASAFALGWLMPGLTAKSNVQGLVSSWINNGATPASAEANLPLYGH